MYTGGYFFPGHSVHAVINVLCYGAWLSRSLVGFTLAFVGYIVILP